MTKKCECPKKNGEKCGAYAPTGKSVCIFHDPARETDGRRARRAGGLRRSRALAVLASATPDHPLGNPKEVSGLLADCINQLHRGELDTRVVNTIGYVTSIHLRSVEQVSAEAKGRPYVPTLRKAPLPPRLAKGSHLRTTEQHSVNPT
jgi:hypothetical protein